MRSLACILALAVVGTAQDLTHKAAPQARPVAIVNVDVYPVAADAIRNGFVLFDKGKLVAIGAKPESAFPKSTLVIDGAGKGWRVYPGLIAAYTQLGLTEIGAVRASRDYDEAGDVTPEVRAAVAVNPDSTLLPVTRRNGVLTFATFPRGGLIPGRASIMRMDGWTWEDMAVRADAGLVVNWPFSRSPRRRRRAREEETPDTPDRYQRTVARIGEAFDDARAYLEWRRKDPTRPVDLRWEAFAPVFEGKRPVFFLAGSYDQIVDAVNFAAEKKVRAVIVGGNDAPLCADLLRRHDVGIVLRSIHRFPARSDSDFDETYNLPARLEAAGLRWCLASGERTANERNLPYSAGRAAAYGLAPDAALKSITLYPARVLGVADRLGSLEAGKSATLIVTDGDPLEVTTNVLQAFVDGRAIDLSSKQTKLYEKYRAKYRQLGLIK